jgi:hypothetical protein
VRTSPTSHHQDARKGSRMIDPGARGLVVAAVGVTLIGEVLHVSRPFGGVRR